MQIINLRGVVYPTGRIIHNLPAVAVEREKTLQAINHLNQEGGCDLAVACANHGISRATYYRWKRAYKQRGVRGLIPRSRRPRRSQTRRWRAQDERLVLQVRRAHPTYGKLPIWRILARDHGVTLSASTVGRILAKGVRLGRIKPCLFYAQGRVRPKRRRAFDGHAQRWRYGDRGTEPGDLIQIDQMSVPLEGGKEFKDFKAICPVSRYLVQHAFGRATANNAVRFLVKAIEQMPFPIRGIQVDGGSEFMGPFVQFCEDRGIGLKVLPPRRPQYNGHVERVNRTGREELYSQYQGDTDLASINRALAEHQHQYNHFRPHRALALDTPMEYLKRLGMAT